MPSTVTRSPPGECRRMGSSLSLKSVMRPSNEPSVSAEKCSLARLTSGPGSPGDNAQSDHAISCQPISPEYSAQRLSEYLQAWTGPDRRERGCLITAIHKFNSFSSPFADASSVRLGSSSSSTLLFNSVILPANYPDRCPPPWFPTPQWYCPHRHPGSPALSNQFYLP